MITTAMRQSTMSREEMIRRLVAFSVRSALQQSQPYWLNELFEKGFSGYRNFSDGKLRRELQLRGLDETDEMDADDEPEEPVLDELTDSISGLVRDSERME
ncbi:MAG: hypothetical protein HY527_09350 [Betaproteobacteria bacterium]|nr:hypothetical protein [Betaproteobacteria bacterium]